MVFFLSALEQTALFFPMAFGIYISYTILKTTDMTTEGSFVLGAGVLARLLSLNFTIGVSLSLSLISGSLAGLGISLIQSKGKLNPLIAGIIGLFLLYTLNFKIMGRPNIGLPIISCQTKYLIFVWMFSLSLGLAMLMASRMALILRALGSNPILLKSLGKNVGYYRSLGLVLSNSLSAFCGSITAIIYGFADLGMGFGMTLTGISTVIIGQQLQKSIFPNASFNIFLEISTCFMGVMSYFLTLNSLLAFGLDPIYLKFVLGLLLIFLLRSCKP